MPTPNAEGLLATLAYIKDHPEEHKQQNWRCGTAFCFAGHATVTIAGAVLLHPDNPYDDLITLGPADFERIPSLWTVYKKAPGDSTFLDTYAKEFLGLTRYQADELFDGDNSLSRIEYLVNKIIAGDLEEN